MRRKARRDARHVEVVECALFATPNSLKSHAVKKLFYPFSNTHVISSKLWAHWGRTASQTHLISKSKVWQSSILVSVRRTSHVPLSAISSLGGFRTPALGERGTARARPASENLHRCGRRPGGNESSGNGANLICACVLPRGAGYSACPRATFKARTC